MVVATFIKNISLKRKPLIYHCLFWVAIYLLWIAVFRGYSFSLTKTMTIEFCYLVFITADYYVINHLLLPRYLQKKKYALFIITTLLTIVFSAWCRALVAIQMNQHVFHAP